MNVAAFCVTLVCLAADEGRLIVDAEFETEARRALFVRLLSEAESNQLVGGRPEPAEIEPATGRKYLTVSLKQADGSADVPLLGDYRAASVALQFRARFRLSEGSTYVIRSFDSRTGQLLRTEECHIKPSQAVQDQPQVPRQGTTEVVSVSPNLAALPANVLKFYVTFSAPMREGREVLSQVQLHGTRETESPWRDIELWNADATRLTLFIHPGRIKQGINLREQFGPLLEPGKRYMLAVSSDMRDAEGRRLARGIVYEFETTDELRERIDVAKWEIVPPVAASRSAVVVGFGRPLDRYLAARCLAIVDPAGTPVAGEWTVEPDGAATTFTPGVEWRRGGYELRVEPTLEDLCGNTPVRVFDHDLEAPAVEVLPPVLVRKIECR